MDPLEKARRTKEANYQKKRSAVVWRVVEKRRGTMRCRCPLEPGMSKSDLAELGGGCTDTADAKRLGISRPDGPSYICPVLDLYRRLMEGNWRSYAED